MNKTAKTIAIICIVLAILILPGYFLTKHIIDKKKAAKQPEKLPSLGGTVQLDETALANFGQSGSSSGSSSIWDNVSQYAPEQYQLEPVIFDDPADSSSKMINISDLNMSEGEISGTSISPSPKGNPFNDPAIEVQSVQYEKTIGNTY